MSKNQDFMSQKTLEQFFTAIQERFDDMEKRFEAVDKRFDNIDKRLDNLENTLKIVLNIVQSYDVERKEVKSTLWEIDRRLLKLERNSA